MAHVVLPTALISLHDALSTPKLSTIGTFLALLAAYLHNLAVAAEIVTVTPWRLKIACYLVHTCTLCLAIFTNLSSTDLISFCANKPFLATTRLALLGFVDKSVTIPFNVLGWIAAIQFFFVRLRWVDDIAPYWKLSSFSNGSTLDWGPICCSGHWHILHHLRKLCMAFTWLHLSFRNWQICWVGSFRFQSTYIIST